MAEGVQALPNLGLEPIGPKIVKSWHGGLSAFFSIFFTFRIPYNSHRNFSSGFAVVVVVVVIIFIRF